MIKRYFQRILAEKFMDRMNSMPKCVGFDQYHRQWFMCFSYTLLREGFTRESIQKLFYDFQMSNWKALHLENTEYRNESKKELIESFGFECVYVSDRISFDRLFRTHWLFRQAFQDEMLEIELGNKKKLK